MPAPAHCGPFWSPRVGRRKRARGGDMPRVSGFSAFASLPEEHISDKVSRRIVSGEQGMVVWWSMQAGVHVETHQHANEQIVWMLKGRMEFRVGDEKRMCGPGDI